MSGPRVSITVKAIKAGWDGTVKVDGEFYAGSCSSSYLDVVAQCAHYATVLVREMESAHPDHADGSAR